MPWVLGHLTVALVLGTISIPPYVRYGFISFFLSPDFFFSEYDH